MGVVKFFISRLQSSGVLKFLQLILEDNIRLVSLDKSCEGVGFNFKFSLLSPINTPIKPLFKLMNGTYLHQKSIPRIMGKIRESIIIKSNSKTVVFELTLRGDTSISEGTSK